MGQERSWMYLLTLFLEVSWFMFLILGAIFAEWWNCKKQPYSVLDKVWSHGVSWSSSGAVLSDFNDQLGYCKQS